MNRVNQSSRSASPGLERAIEASLRLLVTAEARALALADLEMIDLPPAAGAEPLQLRAVASLYLASALEGAGLIDVTDDFVRLVRSGVIKGDLKDAADEIAAFWQRRSARITRDERIALFSRLFGSDGGPVDSASGVNRAFDERMLDLCDTIIAAAEGGSQEKVRRSARILAENIGETINDAILMMAREIMEDVGEAVSILGHASVRAAFGARGLWDVVAAVDRLMRRPRRLTLSFLRRGRAGMMVLAWLAEKLEPDSGNARLIEPDDPVLGAAVDWVDETLTLVQSDAGDKSEVLPPGSGSSQRSWTELAR